MFVDASALCAILLNEPEARDFVARIEAADEVWTSAIAIYETTLAVSRVNCGQVADAARRVMTLLQTLTVAISTIGDAEADAALDAYARFGKGRHPARLNMGDCFAYACARTHGVPLLFKDEDFALTDVEAA